MAGMIDAFATRTSSKMRQLGRRVAERGGVRVVEFDGQGATLRVADDVGRELEVEVRNIDEPAEAQATCSCSAWQGWRYCHHAFAAGVALEEGIRQVGELMAAVNGGVEPGPSVWRRRLQPLLADQQQVPAPIVEFFVEPPGWSGFGAAFTVEVTTRHWRKREREHGERGRKPITMQALARIGAADRALLQVYDPQVNHNTHHWERRTMSVAGVWMVSKAMAGVVVPMLAAARHVHCGSPGGTGEQQPRPLAFDLDEPLRFELLRQEAAGMVSYTGVLRRGDEVIPLGDLATEGWELVGDRYVFLWEQARVVAVEFGVSREFVDDLVEQGAIEAPVAEADAVLASLAQLPGAGSFLGEELDRLPMGQPVAVVTVKMPRDPQRAIRAELQFDYGGVLVDARDAGPDVVEGDGCCRRNREAEAGLERQLLAAGFVAQDDRIRCERERFAAAVAELIGAGMRVLAEGQRLRSFVRGSTSIATGIDWFQIEGEVQFDGQTVALPELLRGKFTPEGFLELGDGSFGMLPANWVARLARLQAIGAEAEPGGDGEHLRMPSSQALMLDAMLIEQQSAGDVQVDQEFRKLRRRIRSFDRVAPVDPARTFRGELRPYQRDGLGWLRFLHDFGLGGCLADDMGLGKTVQVLAHLQRLRARGRRGPSLLVAPRSVVGNWLTEAERFAPNLRVLDFSQPGRWSEHGERLHDYDLLLTTYALVRADAVAFGEREQRFDYVILDEAHAIKNAQSQTAKAVRLLRADHRLALTGTPVENHLGELWSLFEFLNPGMLGRLPRFRSLFGSERGDQSLRENRDLIQRTLRPVLLRRTKAAVLQDLPDKIEQVLWCDLEPQQRRRYDELSAHYRQTLLGQDREIDNKQRFLALEALLRLRQAACHDGLLDRRRKGTASGKFEVLLPRLEELADEGHKVLVFSQFVALLDLLAAELKQRGVAFERLDGRTRKRQERVDKFQNDPDCPVFLISLKAGGTGLNLTAADYVFLLDPWWNPAAEQQAVDRAHRIGQRQTVNAYRLAARGTVEERVLELQDRKRELVASVLGNDRSLLQDLTREDLERLLQ